MPIPAKIVIGCWIVFVLYWQISALFVKKTAERKSFLSSLPYRFLVSVGYFMVVLFNLPAPWNIRLIPQTFLNPWIGAAVCLAGLAICLWSRWTLGRNWSSDVRFKRGHELIRTGPYRFVRHPIYTGILLMCLAPAIQWGQLHSWLGVILASIGFWIKLRQEEVVMLQHFPEYAGYREQVKALVPHLI